MGQVRNKAALNLSVDVCRVAKWRISKDNFFGDIKQILESA